MKRHKQYILMAIAMMVLLTVGCQREDGIDRGEPGKGELQFSPNLGETQSNTRAGESDNSVLKKASATEVNSPHIVIEAYTGTPGNSLTPYFSDKLDYFKSGGYWGVNSGIPRFLPSDGMNLYAYFATDVTDKGDLDGVTYIHPTANTDYPKLEFTVPADDALNQVDLIAAKVEGVTSSDVSIPFCHILSQINFGVKGIDQHQITIKNIRINEVMESGSFDYKTWEWTPDAKTVTYPYYFPDRKEGDADSGSGKSYKTKGTIDDSKNSYIFGDGGKFGPGGNTTFLYAQVDHAASNYGTQEQTSGPLHNALMLLPQEITKSENATVTLDYEIRLYDRVVRSGVDEVIQLNGYYDWIPNRRYVYLFNFENPSEKITCDVLVDQWVNYDGDEGLVETVELNSATLFQKYVRTLQSGGSNSIPMGNLTADFTCDWALYTLDNSFPIGDRFSLSFNSALPFANGKSIIIKPPFGFTASHSSLTAPGVVTFTAAHSYYATSEALNAAIKEGSGNYEFSVNDAVKLEDIQFNASTTTESSLTLRYPSPYNGTLPSRWQLYDPHTVVFFPNDFALKNTTAPYSYTIYTVVGLKTVFDWMNKGGGVNPGGDNDKLSLAERMGTQITLTPNGKYNLAEVYQADAADTKKPPFVPIGKDETTPYTGYFDGQGATLSNLYINSTDPFQGFFGVKATDNKVDNLNLTNVSVTSTGNYIGGIAGYNKGGYIRNCSVTGSVKGNYTVGGIAGSNGVYIFGCRSDATVSGGEAGGISGSCGDIRACYFTGKVNGSGSWGGIAGSGTNMTNSYYVASANIGSNNPTGTRLPSIAVLNSKIGEFNQRLYDSYVNTFKYASGELNATPPSTVNGAPAPRGNRGVLKGTFIQNWFALGWTEEDWNREMALLATLGMEYLVVDQVMECFVPETGASKYMAWYPATTNVIVNKPDLTLDWGTALEKCMTACRTHGIKIYLGTFFDKRYWDSGVAVTGKETEWMNCIETANRVMGELTAFYFNGASSSRGDFSDVLAGWYFPYEVNDFDFRTDAAKATLKRGILSAMTYRNNLTNPNVKKPYLFSPFMNGSGPKAITGGLNATQYAALWDDIIKNSGIKAGDILSPQDCIGTLKLTIGDLGIWMPALQGVADANGINFWINVELMGPGGDVSSLTMQQIPASKSYAAKLISFSYPIYYSPYSMRKLGDHNAYKLYYDAQ